MIKMKLACIKKGVIKIIKIVDGDILQAKENIICHSCNCQGVMGGGIAKQVKEKYPEVYRQYKIFCDKTNSKDLLGSVQLIGCDDSKMIANLFGQEFYGRNGRYTSYIALRKCFNSIYERAKHHNESIAIPFNIGCSLGGGNWDIVYSMIEEVFQDYDVTLYRWEVK